MVSQRSRCGFWCWGCSWEKWILLLTTQIESWISE
jgi:hypothetical protein